MRQHLGWVDLKPLPFIENEIRELRKEVRRKKAQRRSAAFKAARRRRSAAVTPIRGARPAWQRSGRIPSQFEPATLSRFERLARLAP